jgi:hypothetical protein
MVNYNKEFYDWIINKTLKKIKVDNNSKILVITEHDINLNTYNINKININNYYSENVMNDILIKNLSNKKYDTIIMNYIMNNKNINKNKLIEMSKKSLNDNGYLIMTMFDDINTNKIFSRKDEILSDIGIIKYDHDKNIKIDDEDKKMVNMKKMTRQINRMNFVNSGIFKLHKISNSTKYNNKSDYSGIMIILKNFIDK